MSDAIGMEVQFFLTSIVYGILLLVIYDVLRIFRRVVKHKWFFVAVEDLIFWLISAILIFRMMYQQNNGIIRGFSILGMTLGMIVYNQSLSGYAVKGISSLFLLIGKGIGILVSFLLKPVRFVGRRCKRASKAANKKVSQKMAAKAEVRAKKQEAKREEKRTAREAKLAAKQEAKQKEAEQKEKNKQVPQSQVHRTIQLEPVSVEGEKRGKQTKNRVTKNGKTQIEGLKSKRKAVKIADKKI